VLRKSCDLGGRPTQVHEPTLGVHRLDEDRGDDRATETQPRADADDQVVGLAVVGVEERRLDCSREAVAGDGPETVAVGENVPVLPRAEIGRTDWHDPEARFGGRSSLVAG
jgi:hypothetical protein